MWEILAFGGLSFGATTALVTALLVVLLSVWSLKRPAANMPPGPLGYPFIGNLLDLTINEPWLDYLRISKKYGPIFSHKLVTMQTVVVNNLELTKEALLKKQVEFAGRPYVYSLDYFTDGGKDIAFANYGPVWKAQRKIGHSAIRTYAMGENLENLIHDIYPMIEELFEKNMDGPFDPKDSLYLVIYNIISSMVFGCKYTMEDKEFRILLELAHTSVENFGNGFAADVIPFAKYIPTSGLRLLKKLKKELFEIFNRKLKEHNENFDPDHLKDLIDFFLNAQKEAVTQEEDEANKLTDAHVVQMISDVFLAGTDTSIFTMYWALAFMAANPEMQVRVHREICDLIGEDRYPRLADQKSLPYTNAVMRETMRYGIVAPLLVPHSTTCDTELGGYFIPKDTLVNFNMYAVHFDPNEWDNPRDFIPERFLDQDGNLLPKPAAMMPFGAGRRVCMGEILAKSDFFMLFSFIFQRFRVSTVPGTPVPAADAVGGDGFNMPKPYSITISRWEK